MADLPPKSVTAFTVNSEEEIHDENTGKDSSELDGEKTKQGIYNHLIFVPCCTLSLVNLKRMLSPDTHNHATHLRLWMKLRCETNQMKASSSTYV